MGKDDGEERMQCPGTGFVRCARGRTRSIDMDAYGGISSVRPPTSQSGGVSSTYWHLLEPRPLAPLQKSSPRLMQRTLIPLQSDVSPTLNRVHSRAGPHAGGAGQLRDCYIFVGAFILHDIPEDSGSCRTRQGTIATWEPLVYFRFASYPH